MSKLKAKPKNNFLIIDWSKSKEIITDSGIIIPSADQETKMIEMGEVVAVAKTIKDKNGEDIDIKVGDKVLFATFHPFELKMDNKKLYALPASEIIAVLE